MFEKVLLLHVRLDFLLGHHGRKPRNAPEDMEKRLGLAVRHKQHLCTRRDLWRQRRAQGLVEFVVAQRVEEGDEDSGLDLAHRQVSFD